MQITSLRILFIIYVKIFRVIYFRGFHYPQNFFNNKIFPDYGTLHLRYIICSAWVLDIRISTCCSSDQTLLFKFNILFLILVTVVYILYCTV